MADGATTTTDASPSAHTVSFEGNAQLDTAAEQFGKHLYFRWNK